MYFHIVLEESVRHDFYIQGNTHRSNVHAVKRRYRMQPLGELAMQGFEQQLTPGTLGIPCVGKFKNGRGDFYDQETINGKTILVRFSIWGITADTAQSEQAFSDDGGKTWETNWINRYTRD
jgi:hypothetical protein